MLAESNCQVFTKTDVEIAIFQAFQCIHIKHVRLGPELNRCIAVLQTAALPLRHRANKLFCLAEPDLASRDRHPRLPRSGAPRECEAVSLQLEVSLLWGYPLHTESFASSVNQRARVVILSDTTTPLNPPAGGEGSFDNLMAIGNISESKLSKTHPVHPDVLDRR